MEYCQFLEHYRAYTQGNETPENVHLWLGLASLAGASGKQYWMSRGFFTLWLNLFILLIGPPGLISKSSSMSISEVMLEEIGANVYSGTITRAKLIEDLVDCIQTCEVEDYEPFNHASVTWMADEFNAVLTSGGPEIVEVLTELFSANQKFKHRTKGQGVYYIPYPAFTLVGNVVPAWFGKNLATDMTATGLLARFIPIYEDKVRGSYPNPKISDEQYKHRQKALEILFRIQNGGGEVIMSEEAEESYEKWYHKQVIDPTEDSRVHDYLVRKQRTYLLKVAALMALGDLRQEVQTIDIERSVDILSKVDEKLRLAYMIAGANPNAIYINRVLKLLDSYDGKVNLKTVARLLRNDLDNDNFRAVIEQIDAMGYATQKRKNDGWYLITNFEVPK